MPTRCGIVVLTALAPQPGGWPALVLLWLKTSATRTGGRTRPGPRDVACPRDRVTCSASVRVSRSAAIADGWRNACGVIGFFLARLDRCSLPVRDGGVVVSVMSSARTWPPRPSMVLLRSVSIVRDRMVRGSGPGLIARPRESQPTRRGYEQESRPSPAAAMNHRARSPRGDRLTNRSFPLRGLAPMLIEVCLSRPFDRRMHARHDRLSSTPAAAWTLRVLAHVLARCRPWALWRRCVLSRVLLVGTAAGARSERNSC